MRAPSPAPSEAECGNYREQDLEGARAAAPEDDPHSEKLDRGAADLSGLTRHGPFRAGRETPSERVWGKE